MDAAVPALPSCKPQGLTLLELLLSLLAVAVLATLSLPVMRDGLAMLQADLLRMQLHAALATARNTAIVERHVVGACPSADGQRCSTDWSRGWILYRLPAASQGRRPPAVAEHEVLREHRGRPTPTLSAEISQGRPTVQFRSDGRASGSNATISICTGQRLRGQLVINIAGRVRSLRPKRPTPCPRPM